MVGAIFKENIPLLCAAALATRLQAAAGAGWVAQ
jgi:hypothetical protein